MTRAKVGEMNYAKMAANRPDIEGEGDHLLWELVRSAPIPGSSWSPAP